MARCYIFTCCCYSFHWGLFHFIFRLCHLSTVSNDGFTRRVLHLLLWCCSRRMLFVQWRLWPSGLPGDQFASPVYTPKHLSLTRAAGTLGGFHQMNRCARLMTGMEVRPAMNCSAQAHACVHQALLVLCILQVSGPCHHLYSTSPW